MSDLQHRIKVYVYSLDRGKPHYLLLKSAHGRNPTWGALDGPINFGEQIEAAILRELREDVGLSAPAGLIDLQMPKRWLLGDEEIVEWPYGSHVPLTKDLVLDARWSEFRWARFEEAYSSLHLDLDRAAVTRLHTLISAA
jgi:ADP-ribose pyrophosphatase YjhB (NUDIX family)